MIVLCYDDYYCEYKDCLPLGAWIAEARRLGKDGRNVFDVNELKDCMDGIGLILCDYRKIPELSRVAALNEKTRGNAFLKEVPVISISFIEEASLDAQWKYFGLLNIVGHFDTQKRFDAEAIRNLIEAHKENNIIGYGFGSERTGHSGPVRQKISPQKTGLG